jgi:hypothetical protein
MIGCLVLLLAMNAEEKLSLKGAVVHRPATAEEQDAVAALPSIALLADQPQKLLLKLAEQAKKARKTIPSASKCYLLAAGPMLDGPDHAAIHEFTKQNGTLTLQIRHTSARLSGTTLRRNIQWRPLAQVPLELPPGKWKIIVEWSPVSDLPNGKSLGKPTTNTAQFEVLSAASK